jgi:excisionase family DNA binding protein
MAIVANQQPALLTQRQAAAILGVSKRTMQAMLAAGALEPVRIVGLARPRYRRTDVDRLVEGRAP